ncbi:hypothetical protein WJR50_30095 [Catalinimonas sp. 4WD22]|uniref:baeRF3 domain-containing protein n=1 Tax=Catalinimonas locisalis TaxID=3133978 RepID=UPI003101A6C8
MKTNDMLPQLSSEETEIPYVSIVIPLEKTLPARNQNEVRIKNMIHRAKTQLTKKYVKKDVFDLLIAIEHLHEQIDPHHHVEGVGLYVSKHRSQILYFPFPVEEKVLIDDTFEVRNLILNASQLFNYWVLVLSNNHTRLLKGKGKSLEEIQDEHFPLKYEEQFEYPGRQKPRMVGSVVYGSEESQLKEERQREYFRHVEKLLHPYLMERSCPLFVMGEAWYQPLFSKVIHHAKTISGFIEGNYDHLTAGVLVNKVWSAVEAYQKKEQVSILKDIEEKIGQKRGYISGWKSVLEAAQQGKGARLIVEKDYVQPAFYHATTGNISVEGEDIVEEIMKVVLNKKGEITFLEHGQLEKYQRMALLTRF